MRLCSNLHAMGVANIRRRLALVRFATGSVRTQRVGLSFWLSLIRPCGGAGIARVHPARVKHARGDILFPRETGNGRRRCGFGQTQRRARPASLLGHADSMLCHLKVARPLLDSSWLAWHVCHENSQAVRDEQRRIQMKRIAVTSEGPSLDDRVDPRFGRAAGYVVIDLDTMDTRYIDNFSPRYWLKMQASRPLS
jgi:hypothetical protein